MQKDFPVSYEGSCHAKQTKNSSLSRKYSGVFFSFFLLLHGVLLPIGGGRERGWGLCEGSVFLHMQKTLYVSLAEFETTYSFG